MDPAWSDPDNRVVGVQRKHLEVHPITAMLMVRESQVYARAAEVAVLEHHERMDGSGYPRGLAGADITPMGRILLLAEVVTAFYEKYEDMPAQRLSLVLRLNHRKFPPALVACILPLLQQELLKSVVTRCKRCNYRLTTTPLRCSKLRKSCTYFLTTNTK